jgi:alcohol dehydrogenase YqhD (iron-dependent ADH family)
MGWGVDEPDAEKASLAGIAKTVAYFKEIGMPTCFTELGIGVQGGSVLEELADRCVHRGKRLVGSLKPLAKGDIVSIYWKANC